MCRPAMTVLGTGSISLASLRFPWMRRIGLGLASSSSAGRKKSPPRRTKAYVAWVFDGCAAAYVLKASAQATLRSGLSSHGLRQALTAKTDSGVRGQFTVMRCNGVGRVSRWRVRLCATGGLGPWDSLAEELLAQVEEIVRDG